MNLTFGNITLEVSVFHVRRNPQVEEVISKCESPTLVDSLEEEEFEPLKYTLFRFFFF